MNTVGLCMLKKFSNLVLGMVVQAFYWLSPWKRKQADISPLSSKSACSTETVPGGMGTDNEIDSVSETKCQTKNAKTKTKTLVAQMGEYWPPICEAHGPLPSPIRHGSTGLHSQGCARQEDQFTIILGYILEFQTGSPVVQTQQSKRMFPFLKVFGGKEETSSNALSTATFI